MSIYLVNAGEKDLYNISIDSSALESGFIAAGMESKVGLMINNRSPFSQKGKNIRLNINGKYYAEGFADVGSYERQKVQQSFTVSEEGNFGFEFQLERGNIEDDQVLQDNKTYFTANVPNVVRVSLIGETSDETRFPELAMQTAENISGNNQNAANKFYDIRISSNIDESVNESDMIIVTGKNDFTDREAQLLNEFVIKGGGLLFFPGENLAAQSVNDKLLSRSGGIRLGNKVVPDYTQASPKFGVIDFEHPLLNGIFRNKSLSITSVSGGIDAPKINHYYKMILSESGKAIMMLENNDPFLSEVKLGKGKILVSSLSLSSSAGDFPSKSIFVPLLLRAVNYLSGNYSVSDQYFVGEKNIVRINDLKNIRTITNPSGVTDSLGVSFDEAAEKYFALPYNELSSSAGVYKVTDSTGNEQFFALNPNPFESDLTIMEEGDSRENLLSKGYIKVYTLPWSEAGSAYAETKQGTQLWKYFLVLALLALAAEKFLSRKLEKGE